MVESENNFIGSDSEEKIHGPRQCSDHNFLCIEEKFKIQKYHATLGVLLNLITSDMHKNCLSSRQSYLKCNFIDFDKYLKIYEGSRRFFIMHYFIFNYDLIIDNADVRKCRGIARFKA